MGVVLAGFFGVADGLGQTRVRMATLAPRGTSFHQILMEMGATLREGPDGGIALTIFTDGTMGGEADMVRRMRLGQLQAGLMTAVGLAEIEPKITGLQDIPMVYKSLEEAAWVRGRIAPELEKAAEARGFVILGWVDAGWVHVFSRNPLREPADLRGARTFVWAGAAGMPEIVRSLGMQPVALEPTDILVSLQTGLVDIVPSAPFYALAGQFFQPAPHMLEINWAPLVGGIVMSKRAFDRLSPALQQSVRQAARTAAERITETGRREMRESIAAMERRGLKVFRLDEERERRWREFSVSIYPVIRGNRVDEATFDRVIGFIQEYRAAGGQVTSRP